jgi:hypothetical protein
MIDSLYVIVTVGFPGRDEGICITGDLTRLDDRTTFLT